MKSQYDNDIMSSFYLWFDHTLLDKGEAYENFGWQFYPVDNLYQSYYTYGSPFRQFVSDKSIVGANVMDGLYSGNSFLDRGEEGFTGINYSLGQVYFTSQVDTDDVTLSGNYAIKDFNVYMTNDVEEKLLFETQYTVSNKTSQSPTGLPPSSKTYPSAFIKNIGSKNEPFAFGGTDVTKTDIRVIVLADSQFKLDAVSSIFRDQVNTNIPIIPQDRQPFNALGDFKDQVNTYDYEDLSTVGLNEVYIKEVSVSKIGGLSFSQMTNMNPNVFSALIDFEIEQIREPRA